MAFGNMMNGMGGIGQQAADLRDSNTPQQLQQSYQKSAQEGKPDIATLLALNDITQQVKAKEAEMRLAMQPKEPGTVLEQRAAELKNMAVGQNTTEKAEQVGGIAQLQQQKQQQNMQRMAQGTQGPPQGIQTAPQGPQMAPQGPPQGATQMAASGGIIMQGAPNMQRMAGGGIIGFASRGEVKAADMAQFEDDFGPYTDPIITQEMVDAYRKRLARTNSRAAVSASDDELRARLVDNPKLAKPFSFPISIRKADDRYSPEEKRQKQYQEAAGADYDRMQVERLMNSPPTEVQQPLPVSAGFPSAVTTGGPLMPMRNLPPIVPPSSAAPNTGEGPRVGVNPNLGGAALQQVPGTGIGGVNIPTTQGPATGGFTANDPKIQGLQNALATEQADFNKGLLAKQAAQLNPVDAGIAASTRAEKFIGRDRNATQRAAMLQRRKEANEAAADLRDANSFARLTSTAGGVGGLANLGRGAANIRRYDADQKEKELLGELTAEEKNIASDEATARGISKDSLAVQNTTTAANARLDAEVMRTIQQSMTDQGRKLTADQQRALEAQKASMTSADKRALIESNENIAKYNAKTREIIQNSVNAVTMASARLTAQANATQNKNKTIADIVKKMADIQAKRPKQIADLAVANAVLTGNMDKKAKAAYLAKRIKDLDTQMKLAIKPLEALKARLESGVTRVSNSGTKKFDAKGKRTN